jgi:hypothetical protein
VRKADAAKDRVLIAAQRAANKKVYEAAKQYQARLSTYELSMVLQESPTRKAVGIVRSS